MKQLFTIAVILLAAFAAEAQTAVTLQVTDADSQVWAGAPYSAAPSSAYLSTMTPTLSFSGSLSAAGAASLSMAANTWTFRVCPLAFAPSAGTYGGVAPSCYTSSVAVAGGSQTVTLAPPAIRMAVTVGVRALAYQDAEVTGQTTGAKYFNLISLIEKTYNGTTWIDDGTAAPVAFAALPTCNAAAEGQLRPVTDATSAVFNSTIVGGGSNHGRAYCNGTLYTFH